MIRSEYYDQLKVLARETRQKYGLNTPRVLKSDLRRIYRDQGIKIDLWPYKFKKVRGAYFNDENGGPSVLILKGLPDEPFIFTMAHELKHHLADQSLNVAMCDDTNENQPIEIGAEVFAAELIFPEADFCHWLRSRGIGENQCTPEILIKLKRDTKTTMSYAGLVKRAIFNRFAQKSALAGIQWKKLEERLYGEPIYKRIQRFKKRRSNPIQPF